MKMPLDEEILESAATGGAMDIEKWPGMVAPLLERLDHIVYNVFPIPRVPPSLFGQQPFPSPPIGSNSENAAMGNHTGTPPQPQQPDPSTTEFPPPSSERVPDSQPQPSTQQPSSDETLPPPLALLLNSIRSAINSSFTEKPPHTIQRLAELILRPTAHYRTLPAYLRALDRVVSVTSSTDLFPFHMEATTAAAAAAQPNGLLHPGNSATSYLVTDTHAFGSDDSLGGALLTPIPWLSNVSLEGGVVGTLEEEEAIPTERQDLEAISTTISQTIPENEDSGTAATTTSPPADQSEEVPHARGPPVVGIEDLGLQDGKGVQMALGKQATQNDSTMQGDNDGAMDIQPAASANGPNNGDEVPATDQDGDIKLDDSNNNTPSQEGEIGESVTESDSVGEKNPE